MRGVVSPQTTPYLIIPVCEEIKRFKQEQQENDFSRKGLISKSKQKSLSNHIQMIATGSALG